jgi:putative transposase
MKYNPEIHHRRSIRLKGYDYSQPGSYFITLCTYKRQCWFGEIHKGKMHLNQLGNIVKQEWLKSAQIRPNLRLDEWIIMPNHFHGIVWIVQSKIEMKSEDNLSNEGVCNTPQPPLREGLRRPGNSLGSFIGGFKSAVTRRINLCCNNNSLSDLATQLL